MLQKLLSAALMVMSGAAMAALPPVVNGYEQQPAVASQTPAGLVSLYKKVQRLEQEVQKLLGELEEKSYLIESIQKRQRDLYLDTDRRLQSLEKTAPVAALPTTQQNTLVDNTVAPKGPALETPAVAKQAYAEAFAELKAANYPKAIIGFSEFEKNYPNNSYLPNALYWLGEASYVSRDFDRAEAEFKKVLAKFPQHAKAKGALLKLSFIQYENKQWTQARQTLQQVIKLYPGSSVAQLAKKRLDRLDQEKH